MFFYFNHYIKHKDEFSHLVWIGIKRSTSGGIWKTDTGKIVTDLITDWAEDEPKAGDCIVADKDLG